jgi:hypothetical protein
MQPEPKGRRLLPAGTSSAMPSLATASPPLPKKRLIVPVACHSCRKSKAKCSGQRPVCRRCAQHRIACEYATQPGESRSKALKRSYDELEDRAAAQAKLLELLASLPEGQAQQVLQRIRSGTDVVTICNQVMAGDVLMQLAAVPETRFRYKLPYRPEMPRQFVLPGNQYLDSVIYERGLCTCRLTTPNAPGSDPAPGPVLAAVPRRPRR